MVVAQVVGVTVTAPAWDQWARSAFVSDEDAKVLHRLTRLSRRVGRRVWSRAWRYDRSGKMVLTEERWMASSWSHCMLGCNAIWMIKSYSLRQTFQFVSKIIATVKSPWLSLHRSNSERRTKGRHGQRRTRGGTVSDAPGEAQSETHLRVGGVAITHPVRNLVTHPVAGGRAVGLLQCVLVFSMA